MTKKEMEILELAYSAELEFAIHKTGAGLIQTKSKIAKKLEEDGLLEKREVILPGKFKCYVEGYVLTHAGRFAYCASC